MIEPLAARIRQEGCLAMPVDCRREWLEVQRARPGIFRRNGLEPDVMAAALGFESDTDMHSALWDEINRARIRKERGIPSLDTDAQIDRAYRAWVREAMECDDEMPEDISVARAKGGERVWPRQRSAERAVARARARAPEARSGAAAIVEAARSMGMDRVAVFLSSGKDSVALGDLLVESGVPCTFLTKYLVPDLDIDEEVLKPLEERWGTKIIRVAMPRREQMFESDTLCLRNVWDAQPSRATPHTAAFDRMVAQRTGCEWFSTGIRKSDGPQRRMALTKHPNPNPKLKRVYPLADWTPADVWAYIEERKLPVSRAYRLIGRSLDCLNVAHVYPLKAGSPADYDRICNDFPLVDALCWLYEKRARTVGVRNLPRC